MASGICTVWRRLIPWVSRQQATRAWISLLGQKWQTWREKMIAQKLMETFLAGYSFVLSMICRMISTSMGLACRSQRYLIFRVPRSARSFNCQRGPRMTVTLFQKRVCGIWRRMNRQKLTKLDAWFSVLALVLL